MENVETMADCNQITDLDTQIPELHKQVLEHYRDIGLIDANGKATDKAEEVHSGDRIVYTDKTPWSWIKFIVNIDDSRAITCSTIDGNLAVTVPLRSQGSDVVIPATFVMDQKGIENFYGPNGINLPEGYEARNTTKTFQRILEEVQSGKRTMIAATAWIPEATYWDAAFTYQWPESQKLLEKYNTQPGYTQLPTPDIVPQIKTSILLSNLVLPTSLYDKKFDRMPFIHAMESELMKRNPVFPVFVMGPDF